MNALTPSPRLLPLGQRRRLVLIGVIGFALMLLGQALRSWFSPQAASIWSLPSLAGLLLVIYGWARLLVPQYSGLPRPDQPGLDERQQAVMTRAYAAAYRVLAVVVLVAYLYVMLTTWFPELSRVFRGAEPFLLGIGLSWLVGGLPAAILAWNEPDTTE